jgi:hypothetical protein
MLLAAAATCNLLFANRQLRYRAGLLHSVNDEPAAVFVAGTVFAPNAPPPAPSADFPAGRAFNISGSYLFTIGLCDNGNGKSVRYTTSRPLYCGQSRWYFAGELHRDYGPAVTGATNSRIWGRAATPWWCKYHHGKQMATEKNTYMGDWQNLALECAISVAAAALSLLPATRSSTGKASALGAETHTFAFTKHAPARYSRSPVLKRCTSIRSLIWSPPNAFTIWSAMSLRNTSTNGV